MNNNKRNIILTAALFAVFIVFTAAVCVVDVKAIGPQGSSVGFAGINGMFAKLLPYSKLFYKLTQYLGYFALLICLFFAAMGVLELVSKKSLRKVDPGIVLLGAFYAAVLMFYVMFDKVVVNFRPVLEDGALESSYPSSHTMLAVCVFISTVIQISRGKGNDSFKKIVTIVMFALTAVMVVGRLISGVHWFTDIVGGVLLSAALLMAYKSAVNYVDDKSESQIQ